MSTLIATDDARVAADTVGEMAAATPDPDLLWTELCRGGWTTLAAPEARGGAELGLLDLTAVVSAWGAHLPPLPLVPTILVRAWSPADFPTDQALTFAGPGPDGSAPVPCATARVRCIRDLDDPEGRGFDPAELRYDGWPAWAASLPVALAPRATAGLGTRHRAELMVLAAAELTGSARALVTATTDYVRIRRQFDSPIGSFQAVRHRLADMYRDLQLTESAVVWGAAEPERAPASTAIVVANAQRIVDAAIQLHGGFGFTWESGLHRHARHLSVWTQLLRSFGVRLPT